VSGTYFDNNATTPLDAEVREAMLPWMTSSWGNPSSIHAHGQAANAAVEAARRQVARALGASPPEVVFTASGTEANNTVVLTAFRAAGAGGRVAISGLEHPSILGAARTWAAVFGIEVTVVEPDRDGVVPAAAFAEALDSRTKLAALMLANNEVGTVQPVAELAAICRERGVALLVDAVQALGKIPFDVQSLGADYVTVAAHKMHGPLGAAALWVRGGAVLEPLLVGGAQERRRRASTVNVPAIAGFGAACAKAAREGGERTARLAALRARFEAGLAAIPGTIVHGVRAPRLPHTSHVAFPGLVGQELAIRLDLEGYSVSTGAACGSGTVQPSATLLAMGVSAEESIASLRISFGIENDVSEIDAFLPVLAREVAQLRSAARPASGRAVAVAQ
jgi:cysteine desulfurase